MTAIYRLKVGKHGRIVLPKEMRDAYSVEPGDEVTMIVRDDEITLRIDERPEDPLEDLHQLAKRISIGLSAEDLKRLSDQERLKDFIKGRAQNA